MRTIAFAFFLFFTTGVFSQINMVSVGVSAKDEHFNDVKFSPLDGSTVKAGTIFNGSDNDCFIVKLDANRQLVWQKTFPNTGDDAIYRVVVCANGDYLVIGQIYAAGIRRAIVSRLNPSTGLPVWTTVSNNSALGELFWDGIETSKGNIVLAGVDSYQISQSNAFLVMLDASGQLLRSFVSSRPAADEFKTVSELPGGALLVTGFYSTGSNYNADIMEIDSATGSINAENSYAISNTYPGGVGFVNSIWENQCYIRNNKALFSLSLFQGFGTVSNLAICEYDLSTRTLSGNVFYHTGENNAYSYSFYPTTDNDYYIAQSFQAPVKVFVSKITSNSPSFDRVINNSVKYFLGADASGGSLAFAGSYVSGAGDDDAFAMYSSFSVPAGTCNIADQNALSAIPLSLNPAAGSQIPLGSVTSLGFAAVIVQNASSVQSSICFSALPVVYGSFSGNYIAQERAIQINWSTTSEINSRSFEIERSLDGISFKTVGSVDAKGLSSTTTSYSFKDLAPSAGKNIYRIKQSDKDGIFTFSKNIRIDAPLTNQGILSVFPVPARNQLHVNLPSFISGPFATMISDPAGRVVLRQTFSAIAGNQKVLDVSALPSGSYMLSIVSANQLYSIKFVKE